ncbi:MAG TPA: MFS transporter [Firmicutes bacterium]|nr:MFS transporter [Candidatus Fermentithermobacillaceae bacterium]
MGKTVGVGSPGRTLEIRSPRSPVYFAARYVLAVGAVEFFAWKILDPFYLQFLTTQRGLNLSPSQFALFVSLGSWISMILDYPTGAVADKLGRRLSWALAMFSHAVGMLWLSQARTFAQCLVVPVFQGISWGFQSGSREAWLYDHVGEEGTKRAMSLLYVASVPMTLIGVGIATSLGTWADVRLPIAITGLILLVVAFGVLTFPENYGHRERRWLEVLKSGLTQFRRSRILQFLAVESFFMTLPVWMNSAWWLTYLVKRWEVGVLGATASFGVTACGSAVAGFVLSRTRYTKYRALLVYPTLGAGIAFCLVPVAPAPIIVVVLVLVTIAARYFRNVGVTLLRNREIVEERATALSFLGTLEGAFWTLGPLLWGALIETVGLGMSFVAAGVCSFICAGLFIAATAKERR